jgi:hypothetical protein
MHTVGALPMGFQAITPQRLDRCLRLMSALVSLGLHAVVAQADVPTSQAECGLRNEAICRLNGIEYHQPQVCPPQAQTVRPLGHEDCSRLERAAPGGTPRVTATPPLPVGSRLETTGREVWAWSLLLVVAWYGLRRFLRASQAGREMGLPRVLVGTVLALGLSFWVARWVFWRVLAGFHNADSFAPALLAGGAALLAWVGVAALIQWILRTVWSHSAASSRSGVPPRG